MQGGEEAGGFDKILLLKIRALAVIFASDTFVEGEGRGHFSVMSLSCFRMVVSLFLFLLPIAQNRFEEG